MFSSRFSVAKGGVSTGVCWIERPRQVDDAEVSICCHCEHRPVDSLHHRLQFLLAVAGTRQASHGSVDPVPTLLVREAHLVLQHEDQFRACRRAEHPVANGAVVCVERPDDFGEAVHRAEDLPHVVAADRDQHVAGWFGELLELIERVQHGPVRPGKRFARRGPRYGGEHRPGAVQDVARGESVGGEGGHARGGRQRRTELAGHAVGHFEIPGLQNAMASPAGSARQQKESAAGRRHREVAGTPSWSALGAAAGRQGGFLCDFTPAASVSCQIRLSMVESPRVTKWIGFPLSLSASPGERVATSGISVEKRVRVAAWVRCNVAQYVARSTSYVVHSTQHAARST